MDPKKYFLEIVEALKDKRNRNRLSVMYISLPNTVPTLAEGNRHFVIRIDDCGSGTVLQIRPFTSFPLQPQNYRNRAK